MKQGTYFLHISVVLLLKLDTNHLKQNPLCMSVYLRSSFFSCTISTKCCSRSLKCYILLTIDSRAAAVPVVALAWLRQRCRYQWRHRPLLFPRPPPLVSDVSARSIHQVESHLKIPRKKRKVTRESKMRCRLNRSATATANRTAKRRA